MKSPQRDTLIHTLALRFERHDRRHPGVDWANIQERLHGNPELLRSLGEMEATGGEPDVIGSASKDGTCLFCDCAAESPTGRRSLCYDAQALQSRKQHKPPDSAVGMATAMGVSLLTQGQYRELQSFGEFDLKTSSWVATPADVRALGGALFGDRRYGQVFVYHNGAESYYAARGFRAALRV